MPVRRWSAVRVHPQLGTQPARRRTVAVGDRARRPSRPARIRPTESTPARSRPPVEPKLPLADAAPRSIADVPAMPPLVITVCDQAHEELDPPDDWLHWSIPDPVAVRHGSRVRRHGRRAARSESTCSSATRASHMSEPDDAQLDVEVETGTGALRSRPHAPARRRGARHRVPDRRRDRLGDHGQPPLTRRCRPAAAGERGRHRRRADRADPDVRRRLGRPLQPGRHARRPAARARSSTRDSVVLRRRPDRRRLPRRDRRQPDVRTACRRMVDQGPIVGRAVAVGGRRHRRTAARDPRLCAHRTRVGRAVRGRGRGSAAPTSSRRRRASPTRPSRSPARCRTASPASNRRRHRCSSSCN